MGAGVIVTEVDPIRALEALMEGFDIMPMTEAAPLGDLFVTATGNTSIITASHMSEMKDRAILCNVGHYDVEVSVKDLERIAVRKRIVRPEVTEYRLRSGKRLYLLSNGRLVNLAAADGHPAEVMDMSFAGQALSGEYLLNNARKLKTGVMKVPEELDLQIARWRLEAFGKEIDNLSSVQRRYSQSWRL
jgi:adenosylhomocysteinase